MLQGWIFKLLNSSYASEQCVRSILLFILLKIDFATTSEWTNADFNCEHRVLNPCRLIGILKTRLFSVTVALSGFATKPLRRNCFLL